MVIVVTRVGGDGSVLTRAVDTVRRTDPGWWEALVEQAALGIPRPYRPRPGDAIYCVRAGGAEVQLAEPDLQQPLRDLVIAVLAEGDC